MTMLRNRSLLAISLAIGIAFMGIGMVVPVRVLYAQSHGASLAIIGAMASSFLLSNFAFQYPIGWISDLWGRKRILLVGMLGTALLNIGYLFITDPVLFVVLRFVEGITFAGAMPIARAILTDTTPDDQRGEAFGIFSAFLNAGFLLGPAVGGALASWGYNSVFVASFICRLVAVGIVLFLVHDRRVIHDADRERARAVPRRALWTLPLIGGYILVAGDSLYLGFDLTLMPLWMRDHLGATVFLIGVAYAAWALPNMITSIAGGRLADRWSRSTLVLVLGLVQVPLYLSYAALNSVWVGIGLFMLHGGIYGLMQPAVDAHVSSFSPDDARGRVQSVYGAFGIAIAFLASNVLSLLYGVNFRLPLFLMGLTFAACVVAGSQCMRIGERRREMSARHSRPVAAAD